MKKRTSAFLGARTVKTGIAVTLSLFLSHYVPYSLPLLAGAAAIICMQPSISVGIQKGLVRTKATILGGLFGLLLQYIFGSNLIIMGAGASMIIWVCHRLKWEEGITLASIVAIAVMQRGSPDVLPYALGRVISTLIGIIIATLTNTIIAPPRYRVAFLEEIYLLTEKFPNIYEKSVEAFNSNNVDLARDVEAEIEDIKKGIVSLRKKLNHLLIGAKTPLGTILEGSELEECLLFERGVNSLTNIVTKLEDLIIITKRWYERDFKLKKEGQTLGTHYDIEEFTGLKIALQDIAKELGVFHTNIFNAFGKRKMTSIPETMLNKNLYKTKILLGEYLNNWKLDYSEQLDILFIMSIYRVIYDLEEIVKTLTELVQVSDKRAKNKMDV